MQTPKQSSDEDQRLQALRNLDILDTPSEERFDRLTRLAKRVFQVDIALVSLVDEKRQWFKSRQGLDVSETAREVSFCGHSILGDDTLVVPDTLTDPRFSDNPLVTGEPHIRFYAGTPLKTSEGYPVGTLCIIDSHPRELSVDDHRVLEDLAGCVEDELNLHHEQHLRRQIQHSGERAQSMLEAIPDLVFVMDRNGTFLNCQERSDLLIPKDELLGRTISDVMPSTLAQTTLRAIGEALDQGRVVKFETPFDLPQGPALFEARVRRLNSYEVLLLIRNVTREKANERRLAGVLEGTRIGTWEWNVQSGATVFNERWAEIVGYSLAELEPADIATWRSLAHPDDLIASERLLNEHFSGAREFYDVECRVRHKSGHWVWVRDRGRVVSWTEEGLPLMMYGTHADISAQKRAEHNALRQIEALTTLNTISSNSELSVHEQLHRALRLGLDYLHLDVAIVSEVNGERYTVRWFDSVADLELEAGQQFRLGDTYCSMVLESGDLLAIDHMAESQFGGHPCYQAFSLEAYVGTAITVSGKRFGTLSFSSSEPRQDAFDDGEIMFVRLLARWVASVLERAKAQERLHKLVSQVPGMVYQFQLWPDGRVSFPYSSPGIRDIYEVTADEVAENAQPVFEKILPDDLWRVQDSIDQSVRHLSVWHCQYRTRTSDGRIQWLDGRATPEALPDGSILCHGYIHDITEQKRAEQVLAGSEARLRGLFELSPLGIALNDFVTGKFIEANDALASAMGYRRAELAHLSYRDVAIESGVPVEWAEVERVGHGERFGPYETEHRCKDGSHYPVLVNGMVIIDPLGHKLIWSFIEDIRERKRIERIKNEFVSTVSHELRTPLTSIAGALKLVVSGTLGVLPEQVGEMIAIAYKNSQRLSLLINDLLDMEKLISGKMHFDIRRQSLLPLIQLSLDHSKAYAEQYDVRLELVPAGRLDVEVEIDALRLEQIMANLLSNAVKFSPRGGVVQVQLEVMPHQVRVNVIDQGPGVPPEFRSRIFQKFAQADSSDSREKGGTGLGLAITKELVERQGGRIDYVSEPGRGTRFFFNLPIQSPVRTPNSVTAVSSTVKPD